MVFPRTLTPKGTGLRDFQRAVQSVTGSIQVGTVRRINSVGTVRNIVAGQLVMTGIDIQARYRPGTVMRDRRPLGQGSTWLGSWQDISNYRRKTYTFQSLGTPGSFAAIVGLVGSGVSGATGTVHLRRIGRGSYGTYEFEGAFRYTRPWFRRGGGTFVAGRGTVTVAFARQA